MSLSSLNTAPHHLHQLLSKVRESSQNSYAIGWAHVLEVEWGTQEFARRHAEVVNLLVTTIEQLHALPERSRDRSLRYVPAWWTAITQPKVNWTDSSRPASSIVTQEMLDHLESAADLIAGNLTGTTAAPRGDELEDILNQCHEWLGILNDISEEVIAGSLRDQLISQIQHLIWLIDNVELFGGARVSAEASRVVGSLAEASMGMGDAPPETVSHWKKGWFALVGACLAFNLGVPAVQESIESGTGLVKEIAAVVGEMQRE